MKKIYFLLSLILLSFTSIGQQLLYEPFNYTPDATLGLATQSGGVWSPVNTNDSILVASGNLSYTGLPASTGNKVKYDGVGTDYYTSYTSQTTGTVYSSFILNVTSLGTLGTAGGYFTGVLQAASTSSFGATVWTRLSTTAGKYNVGISTRSNSAVSWLSNDLDLNTSYFIVTAYDIVTGTANDVARIWLNPTPGGAEPAAGATAIAGTDLTSVARIFLRQDNATNTPFIELDEYRVGLSWASVAPGGAPSAILSASALTGFGNVCINTTAGPNSFTITGTNLTTADVTVAALTGYTFSATFGGTYTPSLNINQPGGSFSQQVFVKFTPTLVQAYNGNIVVGGGGATSVNVAATGSGVNTAPSVAAGTVTSITNTSAVVGGVISGNGCSPVTVYGIEYSTTSGFANGSGTQVPSTNLSGGNFSSSLNTLAPGTTYYFKAFATNAGGTTYSAELSFTTTSPLPLLSASTLTGFGNVCINTASTANSFTINGTNLTTANIVVGPLAGYSFSTTSGGTYTNSLTLTQPGGSYSQQIFVKLTPTTVQSYNGNIPVSGGGTSAAINVAATGAGVNSAPTLTTGTASAITTTTATLAGTIASNGCSAVTAYGIEYSTVNGFANGTGAQVPSTNQSGGSFTSAVSGLTPSTTYYFKAYATNAGGTGYGAQQSFVTTAPPPAVLSATTLNDFGKVCPGDSTPVKTFTISGSNLTNANIIVGPLNGFRFSLTVNGPFTTNLNITQPGGSYNQVIYVKLAGGGVAPIVHNGNITISGGGAPSINVVATGSTIFDPPTVTTKTVSNITNTSATLNGYVGSQGCVQTAFYGFFVNSVPNLPSNILTGNWVRAGGVFITNADFSYNITGLLPNTTYYIKAFADNGATGLGSEISFKTAELPAGFSMSPVPVNRGRQLQFSLTNLKQGYLAIELFNSSGQQVFKKSFNIQNNFINDRILIPYSIPAGVYYIRVINDVSVLHEKTILISN